MFSSDVVRNTSLFSKSLNWDITIHAREQTPPSELPMYHQTIVIMGLDHDFKCSFDTFYQHGLTLIPAGISNYIPCVGWTYSFPNFNEWINNFIPHFTVHMIIYPSWD